jgi:ribonucleoside-diphosphate reductase beta chain
VVNPVEDAVGLDRSVPTDSRWFNAAYDELFARNERAMHRLLDAPTPENFARAYSHYHLVIEGILAQTGYYGLQQTFAPDTYPELPHLPGLTEGFTKIRQDEGRHVGFGMAKLKGLVTEEEVDPQLLDDTVTKLMPLVDEIAANENEQFTDMGVTPAELQQFATEKHVERMRQIRDADAEIPDVETLTRLDD